MKQLLEFNLEDILPEEQAVLSHQGIPPGKMIPGHIQALLEEAFEAFTRQARPNGILQELTLEEFSKIYEGEGENDPESPLGKIYPNAEALAVFALTMGSKVSGNIEELFAGKNFALGSMLDAVASLAADEAAAYLERQYEQELAKRGRVGSENRVLGYSPGYCGWHISAQKQIFKVLEPEQIGISLNSSYLMTPIKSVSGVLVGGPGEIHLFKPAFSFCNVCKTHSCQARFRELISAAA